MSDDFLKQSFKTSWSSYSALVEKVMKLKIFRIFTSDSILLRESPHYNFPRAQKCTTIEIKIDSMKRIEFWK